MDYYKAKIKYSCLIDGEAKPVTEFYLFEAVSFTEVEALCNQTLQRRIKTPDVDAIGKMPLAEVLFYPMQDEDFFFLVKTQTQLDGKKVREQYLVPATDYKQAGERVTQHLKHSLVPYEITHVDKSEIKAYYMPKNEIWEGDWHNRMERYADEKLIQAGYNQLDLFDDNKQRVRNDWQSALHNLAEQGIEVTVTTV